MYETNRIDRQKVEQLLISHKKSFSAIKEQYKNGVINDNTPLYVLEDVILLMYLVAVGHRANCQKQKNPKSAHSDRQGTALAKKFIKMAFVKKK